MGPGVGVFSDGPGVQGGSQTHVVFVGQRRQEKTISLCLISWCFDILSAVAPWWWCWACSRVEVRNVAVCSGLLSRWLWMYEHIEECAYCCPSSQLSPQDLSGAKTGWSWGQKGLLTQGGGNRTLLCTLRHLHLAFSMAASTNQP